MQSTGPHRTQEEQLASGVKEALTYLATLRAEGCERVRVVLKLLTSGVTQQEQQLTALRKQVAELQESQALHEEQCAQAAREASNGQGLGVEAQVQLAIKEQATAQQKQLQQFQEFFQAQLQEIRGLLAPRAGKGPARPHAPKSSPQLPQARPVPTALLR